jgi:hypothetical protein
MCRKPVDEVKQNPIINNLIQVYLESHPEAARSSEEINELEAKNKITHDLYQVAKPKP